MAYRSHVSDHSYEASIFKFRAIVAAIICLLMLGMLLFRLAWLQIVDYDRFADLSENNRIRLMELPPTRGLIYDRNGVILAENKPTFHLELIPEQVEDMDATLKGLAEVVNISEAEIERFKKQLRVRRSFQNISLRTRLNEDEVARLAVNRHRFPGMDINARLSRYYPQGAAAAHALGYVGRINAKELVVIDEGNYRGTTHIGKTGIEKYYESELHGMVGRQRAEVNAQGRILRVIDKVAAVSGNDLVLNLDMELQNIAHEALGDLAGSVIAIEPHTGAVVVFVSKPGFDPNFFVHGISHKNYDALQHDIDKPLFNRAIFGQYPPGSTFKPFVGLAGVEQKRIGTRESIYCSGHYLLPGDDTERKYRDWKKEGHGTVDLTKAMEQSCDVYYYELAYRMGINSMHDFLAQFGFGKKTGLDLLGERRGLLPSTDWKKRTQGKIWYPGETLISGIGQGYMLATPIQLAVATAALASRGEKIVPRLLKEVHISNEDTVKLREPSRSMIKLRNENHWNIMFNAMKKVVHGTWGTARATGWGMKFKMAGKTGTAQVFGIAQDEEYDEETVAKKLRDHGLFIGFGPVKDPVLAVAVVAENGEHGSAMAPIARKIIELYIDKYTVKKLPKKQPGKKVSVNNSIEKEQFTSLSELHDLPDVGHEDHVH